jgi:hypothetical protein
MDTFQWCRRFMTMFLADDHVEVNRVGHCNPQDPGYDWLRFTGSERSLRGNLQECRLLVSVDAGPPVVLVRRTPEVSPRRVVHISARDLLVASLQTSGAVLSKPAGRQRSLPAGQRLTSPGMLATMAPGLPFTIAALFADPNWQTVTIAALPASPARLDIKRPAISSILSNRQGSPLPCL